MVRGKIEKIISLGNYQRYRMSNLIVRGPALSRSGYGEHCRFLLRSLKQLEGDVELFLSNTDWGQLSWISEDSDERRWIDKLLEKTVGHSQNGGTYDISVQVTIPNEWEKIAPINVGVTAGIETNLVSPQWVEKSMLMDRIITISEHSKMVYENTKYEATNNQTGEKIPNYRCTVPIDVVHYPVREYDEVDLDIQLDYDFNFAVVAQWGIRKNLENTIKWFVEEFRDEEVGLVVKTSSVKNNLYDRESTKKRLQHLLHNDKDRKCKVYLLHGSMSDEEIMSLYRNPKIKSFISLAHGEGFGLPIFEAACNALPVVAPDWSGQCDYLHMPVKNKKGKSKIRPMFARVDYTIAPVQQEAVWEGVVQANSQWCYPDPTSYKNRIREVYKDYGRFKKQSEQLKDWIYEEFDSDKQHKLFAEKVLGREITTVAVEELPKVSIITSVYDGDEYIESFLEDITRQTIFKDKCELIIINANSPGDEEKVILQYKEKYPDNIVYKKLKKDPGIYGVWNMGVELSTGEYLTNANLDDRKSPNSLEKHAKELFLNEKVDLVYADMAITDVANEVWENNTSSGKKYTFPQFSFENLKMVNMPHASPMWRSSVHEKYGLFDDSFNSAGDWEMWLRAASQGSQFKKINDMLGLYYFNPTGISTNPENFDWKREEEVKVFEKYKDLEVAS